MKTFCRLYYRIPFSETDAMAIVHHSNHARYLERGRVEFLRLVGLSYTGIMSSGNHFPLTDLNVSFRKPLVFDEVIMIETSISELTAVRLNFAYKIFSVSELKDAHLTQEPYEAKPSVEGETFHCCVNNSGRPVAMNQNLQTRFKELHEVV